MEKEKLEKLINDNLSQREIAIKLKKGQTTIRYWLKKFNLQTNNLKKTKIKKHLCRVCHTTNGDLFYGKDKVICGDCHNDRVKKSGKLKREYALKKMGGTCINCGFNLYSCSLDIHHLNSENKDVNFKSMRGWSLSRIDKEIENCVLLCKNCHAACHNGHIKIQK